MRPERILVATDLSSAGARAIDAGLRWARRSGAALRVLHVAPSRRRLAEWLSGETTAADVARAAKIALSEVVARVDPERSLEVSSALVTGAASQEIVRAALAFDADLVVIGARGEHDPALAGPGLGGTAGKLLQRLGRPLLLARATPADAPPVVLAGVDLGPGSAAIVDWALAAARGGTLHVVHVHELPYAGRLASYGLAAAALGVHSNAAQAERERALAALLAPAAAATDVRVESAVEQGRAAALLAAHGARRRAHLIVVGSRRRGAARASSGYASVCHEVAQYAPCDVLVVPPG